jgi:uncharacterized DUF497 family protein
VQNIRFLRVQSVIGLFTLLPAKFIAIFDNTILSREDFLLLAEQIRKELCLLSLQTVRNNLIRVISARDMRRKEKEGI